MNLSFYPVDITYEVKDGKPIIKLFGRTTDGKQVCVLDDSFEPYFYVQGTVSEKKLESVQKDEFKVVRVEKCKKNVNEKEEDLFKVIVNIPKGVPVLKEIIVDMTGVKKVYEYDILFTRRYLLDKKIVPLTKTKVVGEKIAANCKVDCIKAKSIKKESDEIIEPRIVALDIETYNPDNSLNAKKNPIIILGLYGDNFSRVVTWKKFKTSNKYIEFVSSEADMLQRFAELITEYQPDIITGYFTDGFDFPYIVERAKINKVELDVGLDYSTIDIRGRTRKEASITGIAHVDIFKFIIRVIARSLKTDQYSLNAVANELLGATKHDVDIEHLFDVWDKGGKNIEQYCEYNLQDCKLTYDLTIKLLPNLIEFVRIIGLPIFDVNRMSFSTFVEWYLIKKAQEFNEIILSKPGHNEERERMHDRIQGAFVYEPKPGLYEKIVVFDYRSLYPSIIASLNISKGLVNCKCCKKASRINTDRGEFWFCTKQKGFFSEIISELITHRAKIKKELKQKQNPLLAAQVEALKVLANSFYGYLGFAPARWYCIECAESTTAWARHYIHKAIDSAKKEGFDVLYSDTDSVFVQLGKKSKKDALDWVKKINDDLPGLMELEFEGFYPAGLFVATKASESGAKKKYALLDEKKHITIKGFEAVRRNWSIIAKEVQQEVLRLVLNEKNTENAKKFVRNN